MSKLTINFIPDNFQDFLDKLDDLSKIGDTLKIKIDDSNIFMYSIMGGNHGLVLAFKSFSLKTKSYIKDFDSVEEIQIIIPNVKKFVKGLSLMKNSNSIVLDLQLKNLDDSVYAKFIQIKSGKMKISSSCGEEMEIKDITTQFLSQRLNINNKNWSFSISKLDFADVKKLSSINSESKILNVFNSNNKTFISETSSWEIEIEDSEGNNGSVIFNKSFLSNINSDVDMITFHVFDSFLLIKDENSHLMISFEQSFDDE